MIFDREIHLRFQNSPLYLPLFGVTAFFMMIFGLIPFEVVLIPAVAAQPKRWRSIALAAVIGSAVGAAVLTAVFQYFGLPLFQNLFPNLETSKGWAMTSGWLSTYGSWAMVVVAALPIAQAPALAVAGLFRISPIAILFAFLVGKSVKYSLISLLTARGEERLAHKRP